MMRFEERIKTSRDFIEGVVRSVFPSASVRNFSASSNGKVSSVYKVEMSCPDRILGLRISRNGEAKKESDVSALLKGVVPVPPVISSGDKFMLTEWLPGMTLEDALKVVDSDDRRLLAFSAGEVLAGIHSVALESFGFVFDDDVAFPSARSFLLTKLDTLLSTPLVREAFGIILLEELKAFCSKHIVLFEGKPCLLAGDYKANNINVINEPPWRINGVYDFGGAFAGVGEWDFSKFFRHVTDVYPDMKRPFLNGYKQKGLIKDGYEKRVRVFDVFWILL
ncbi:aminoglycoside phosphotransferase family protein, partial [Candidatus Woesearchaeota archaeon]|nr:aminoglycoside phosphotransferase family protein [Candidatus Woesearchaeota archaeon]